MNLNLTDVTLGALMALAHLNASTAPRAFAFRVLAALALAALCALALSSCGHEPEIATPPADYGQEQQNNTEKNIGAQDDADDATAADDEASEQDDASAESDASDGAATQATHEGPFVVRILNAGGADGLAGAAQETLAGAGIAGDNYQISTDSYLAAVLPSTIVYVTGEGDDAAVVRAEADKIAAALGGEVRTFNAAEVAEGTTMDGLDILVLVGANAI